MGLTVQPPRLGNDSKPETSAMQVSFAVNWQRTRMKGTVQVPSICRCTFGEV